MESGVQDWLHQCSLPDGTELQEHTLKTERNMIIGDRCTIDYGLKGEDIIVCEFCTLNGSVIADGDVRIDNWCEINGDVVVAGDAYLGEGVKIHGRLIVQGDLDIGDNVQIDRGFEAKGWISIRNPMPVIVYLLLYVMTLLKIEDPNELEKALSDLFGDEEEDQNDTAPLLIPPNARLDMKVFSVPAPMCIGSGCRLHGNIKANSVEVGNGTTIFGSLRAHGAVGIGTGTMVHGNVEGEDEVTVAERVRILGDVVATSLVLHEEARIDGVIRAPKGVRIDRNAENNGDESSGNSGTGQPELC
ncbi:acyltransferase [Methanofollis formosanus]|uniref:Acyltransferase n=1 Tax=Methanofollis formosanus TaxID=299308 RepID=A0A8G1EG99_9EURY|nr:polymer-forming cytoskeletal protein [Methanofollis formosanus]QYZ78931.1 acyltransferase [Methanofollis formosanus]